MEIVDIDLDIDGNVMPPKTDLVALIDADTLAYTTCLNVEVEEEILSEDFYSEEEWDALLTNPQYNAETQTVFTCDIDAALLKAEEKLQRIFDKTGCQKADLHFTAGKKNFRYKIYPEYKAHRTGRPPAGLYDLKQALCEKYFGAIHTQWEADDAVVALKRDHPEQYVLCAVDKDVLNSLPGKHFNYYESALYNKEMKWVEVEEETAMKWRFLQTLMGDKTDNIIGLHGIGPKKAEKILAEKTTKAELWEAVVEAYKLKGRTTEEALLNMNLVDMDLLHKNEIKLRTLEDFK